jgi:hypothetical protein
MAKTAAAAPVVTPALAQMCSTWVPRVLAEMPSVRDSPVTAGRRSERCAITEASQGETHPCGDSDVRPGDLGPRDPVRMLVIDAANVIGSRPTGWWRDRPGATRDFTERVRATVTAGRLGPPVTIVLEGQARAGADEADVDGVEVVHAPGEGDDRIAAIAEANRDVVVVTADRELAERVRAANAEVVGPSWLLDQLVD